MSEQAPVEHFITAAVPPFAMAWRALLLDARLSGDAVRLYLVLATYCRSGRMAAFPRQEVLARELNCSVDSIQRYGKSLTDTGWIIRKRRGNGRSNVYYLQMPRPVDMPVDAPIEVEPEAADLRLPDGADLRLPIEVNELEVVTPPTPRKRGERRARDRSPLTASERADDFAAWWAAYPKKVGKIESEQAWRQMQERMAGVTVQTMIEAAEGLARRVAREHPETLEWTRYMPNPATWLRRGDFLVDEERPVRPPTRNPCALCGVQNPSPAVCLGLGKGLIGDLGACIWAE